MRKVLVCGSIAYDYLLKFEGKFEDQFLAEDLARLSVSFTSFENERFFGGCGANIAYGLKMLGATPVLFDVIGEDFGPYFERFERFGISTEFVEVDEERLTAAAYVMSDVEENQVSFFSLGAMQNSDLAVDFEAVLSGGNIDFAVVSPSLPGRMLAAGRALCARRIPYLFDPGQAIPILSKEDLLELIDGASGLIVNEYEVGLLSEKLGGSIDDLAGRVDFLIETLAERGVCIYSDGDVIEVPAVEGLDINGVTGCGDAFRAGFIHGRLAGGSFKKAAEMGCIMAAYSLENSGCQNYEFDLEEFDARVAANFSSSAE